MKIKTQISIELEKVATFSMSLAKICEKRIHDEFNASSQCCCTHTLKSHPIISQWTFEPNKLMKTCESHVQACAVQDCNCPEYETDNLEYLRLMKAKRIRDKFLNSNPLGIGV